MRLIIAGGRDYQMTADDWQALDKIPGVAEVVSGGAPGADKGGEEWARSRSLPVRVFDADWSRHGRAAGPIRNEQMAGYADALAIFPGGRGSDDMLRRARAHRLTIYVRVAPPLRNSEVEHPLDAGR